MKTFAVYTANLNSSSVTCIDTTTDKVIANIPVGSNPYDVVATHDGRYVFSLNSGDGTLSMINTTTNTVVSTITVGQFPMSGVISQDDLFLYVACRDSEYIAVVNISTQTLVTTIPLNFKPVRMAITPDGKYIFVQCINAFNVPVIDTETLSIIKRITLPTSLTYTPTDLLMSKDGKYVYFVSYQRPFIGMISVENLELLTPYITFTSGVFNPTSICTSQDGKYVFVAGLSRTTGMIMQLSTAPPLRIIKTKFLFAVPYKCETTPDSKKLITLNSTSGSITIFDINNLDSNKTVYLGGSLTDIEIRPESKIAYVTNQSLNIAIRVDLEHANPVSALPTGNYPISLHGTLIEVPTPSSLLLCRALKAETNDIELTKNASINITVTPTLDQSPEAIIYGNITAPDNNPIVSASVKVLTTDGYTIYHDITDSKGFFTGRLPAGEYTLIVVSPDYNLSYVGDFILEGGEQKNLSLLLNDNMVSKLGVIFGEALGSTLEGIVNGGANLYRNEDGTDRLYVHSFTSINGRYRIAYIPQGIYTLRIAANGYLPQDSLVVIDKDYMVISSTNKLSKDPTNPQGKISGTVMYNGVPVDKCLVEIYRRDRDMKYVVAIAETKSDGYFEFGSLPAGTYFIETFKLIPQN
ncbi:carboxypeptidase regulatory-like domain-containing protein [Caloramator sp. ALD01]|uniref:carboxypeptidase regulatory-like domain-containing protein n=1 Tax=Caloramator sp. ALD01 TaxID=1031288 RepID=UPI000400F87E|nr:carboxypeptidase regulatory-like domain-containing protein [Caloramator sp. ALD01]